MSLKIYINDFQFKDVVIVTFPKGHR